MANVIHCYNNISTVVTNRFGIEGHVYCRHLSRDAIQKIFKTVATDPLWLHYALFGYSFHGPDSAVSRAVCGPRAVVRVSLYHDIMIASFVTVVKVFRLNVNEILGTL